MQEVKTILENDFGTKVTVQGNVVKTTVTTINGNQIWGLKLIYDFEEVDEVTLKRSGTGITILVTLNY
jgi:hypothetical protein